MKGVLIVQPKDWTAEDGPESVVETLYETYAEAEAAWDATDKDANYVSIWECNYKWFDRRCIKTNTEN